VKAHDVRSFHPGQVSAAIRLVCETPWSEASGFGHPQKEAFLEAATHAHGRAALCLSGGGAVALYHLGLVHELLRHGLLPSVISGTSGGSLTAGMLAVRTGDEMIASLYLPISPYVSPYLPISPHISPYLPTRCAPATR